MKLAGALLVMGILAVVTGTSDTSTASDSAGEEASTAAGDTGTTPVPEPETTTDNSAGKTFPLSVAFILVLPVVLALGGF